MFEVSQKLYYQEMAQAVYEHLREFLITKERNHCQRVEYLPREVMVMTCQKLRQDKDLLAHEVEAYVLSEKAEQDFEIESGALIEKRNRENFGVLVAFIPQGLHLPAEDSFDIHTFKAYDLAGVLRAHCRKLLNELVEPVRSIATLILEQPSVRRQPVERQLKYLIALDEDGQGWEEAGAYLYLLELIPDLKLSKDEITSRMDRSRACVEELSNPDRTVLQSIEKLTNNLKLNAKEGNLDEALIRFFRERNVTETGSWLKAILAEETWRSLLTFDKWSFRDIMEAGKVQIHLQPLEDPKTGKIVKGLKKEGSNLVATTDPKSPVHLRWETNPKNPENLGHYLVTVVRDTEDENFEEELVRKTIKKGRSSLKLSLKDLNLEEGETCSAKIIIYAKDTAGVIFDHDESESFWIEGRGTIENVSKKIKRIRNRAEAIFAAVYKVRKPIEVDSENWEDGSPRLYRIKLQNRDIYRIVINPTLHEIQLKNITDPSNGGAWQADARNLSHLKASDLRPVAINGGAKKSLSHFIQKRKDLFEAFQDHDVEGVMETLDLRLFEDQIIEYVTAYLDLLEDACQKLRGAQTDGAVNNTLAIFQDINRIDTIHLQVGSSEEKGEVVLLCPTHPLRLLWILQYQNLLYHWSDRMNGLSEEELSELINPDNIQKISPLNIPSSLSFGKGQIYVNTDNIDLYWSIFAKGNSEDIRKLNSYVFKLLNIKQASGNITTITPEQVADKFWRYLKHHPYITTLKINVINPGDGQIILNAIRELQALEEFKDMNYDVSFYGDMRYEMMGNVFDKLTEENLTAEGQEKDVDGELLQPNPNPLFPKLLFSKKQIKETIWPQTSVNESHLTVLIDRFSTKVLTRPVGEGVGSFSLHNLLAEYQSSFDLKGDAATWSRKILSNQNQEIKSTGSSARLIYEIAKRLLHLSASFYNWGNSLQEVPAIQLELSNTDKYIINNIHENSDWILTIDRNFGIEYFDNPRKSSGNSYLIDYTPEFLDSIGHRLIVSTYWLSEIEGLIKDGLKKMGIPGTGFHAVQILDILKSISGKLALKLINNPKDAREIIGLALTRLLLEKQGKLSNAVLVPVDSHANLFFEHKRQSRDETLRVHRSDLLTVTFNNNTLRIQLIEVKFRSGAGAGEEYSLKEQIVTKNEDTQRVIEALFQPKTEKDRFDRDIQNQELARLIEFYLERCIRHGLIQEDSKQEKVLRNGICDVVQNNFKIVFEKAGYIFNLYGVSKAPDHYKNNLIYVIGKEEIAQLLDLEEIEEPAFTKITEEVKAEQAPKEMAEKPQH